MRIATMPATNAFYGWFDDADQISPTYDPPHDAPCLLCGIRIHADDVRTHSLLAPNSYAARSYFYRTHRTCADKRTMDFGIDELVLRMIETNGD
jgi:hypothetical protein